MTEWVRSETRELVKQVFGIEQARLVAESSRSVQDRLNFFSYHLSEAIEIFERFEEEHLKGLLTMLQLRVAGNEEKRAAFDKCIIEAGAHALAAVQCLHAIPDIFAHVIYFGSGRDLQPYKLKERDVSRQRVSQCVKKDPRFHILSAQLDQLQSGPGWKQLANISNMGKHRSIVRTSYTENHTGTAVPRELQISAFEFDGNKFPAIGLRKLLEPEAARIATVSINAANSLSVCLRSLI